jgi:hypothetical protein
MCTNSRSNFLAGLLGVDEQFVHFGVQMSQGPKVFGTQSLDKMCGLHCHYDHRWVDERSRHQSGHMKVL